MSGAISTRNGVPPEASDPPGGIPLTPDPQTTPHQAPGEAPSSQPRGTEPLDNEPPLQPPHREAAKRSHHKAK